MEKRSFTAKDTIAIKGIALIMMISNHLFPIIEWIYPSNMYIGLNISGRSVAALWGGFSKICVAMFAFLTGVAFYYSYKSGIKKGYIHNLKKLPRFLLTYYLIILLVYVPIIYGLRLRDFSLLELIRNILLMDTTYCRIAWYVRFYVMAVVLFPFWMGLFVLIRKLGLIHGYVIVYLIQVILYIFSIKLCSSYYLQEYLFHIPLIWIGTMAADIKLFEKIDAVLDKKIGNEYAKLGCSFVILASVFIMRGIVKEIYMLATLDIIYAPAVLFALWQTILVMENLSIKIVDILNLLGKYSLELWFLHAIFFIGSEKIQRLAYFPKVDIFILIWVIAILCPIACVIKKIVNRIIYISVDI